MQNKITRETLNIYSYLEKRTVLETRKEYN